MKPRIQRQADSFAYHRLADRLSEEYDVPGYPYDSKKSVWTPEEEALAAEMKERLQYKRETGEIPTHPANSAEGYTQALQEGIQMRKERDEYDDPDWGYDKAFNDWEAGNSQAH
jgi:hypothetical protein